MKVLLEKIKFNKFLLVVFGINFFAAFLSIIYFVIRSGGLFTLVDDFNAQEIPFNIFCNNAIKSGEVFWNWNIDIGSDFVSTFSFYNLGSPFFWITLLFPAGAFPYLMPWVYMLKYAFAGLFAYMYIRKFVKKRNMALVGSMLYAFSGFQSCNLVFYHFHDAVALFPLMLIGLETLIRKNKRGLFAFTVFINAFVNYFFFIGEVIFVIIYYVVRFVMCRYPDIDAGKVLRDIGKCMLEGVIGVMMAALLFVPSVASILQNGRTSSHLPGSQALSFDTSDVLRIIRGMFFPADIMNSQSSITDMNWYSISAYLPLFGMFLVCVYVTNKKKDWISRLLKVCLVMALVPLLNNVFVMFTSEYYRRWYYMPVLIMALATSVVLANRKEFNIKKGAIITGAVMAAYLAFMCLYPFGYYSSGDSAVLRPVIFAVIAFIGVSGVIASFVVIRYSKKYYNLLVFALTFVYCVSTTFLSIFLYRQSSPYSSQEVYARVIETANELEQDTLPYRYRLSDWYNNLNLAGSLCGRNSFISTVDPSIFEFYESMGIERHTHGPEGWEGTSDILSVKYFVNDVYWDDTPIQVIDNGYQVLEVYESNNALPIGFTYDTYMRRSDYEKVPNEKKAIVMLKTLIVDDEDEDKVKDILPCYNEPLDGYVTELERSQVLSEHTEVSRDFWHSSTGFGSTIIAGGDKYAFYSVPFNNGWTAKVNGEEAEILKVNGLMAVKVSEGANAVEFVYSNKSLKAGFILSIAGFVIFAGYLVIWRKKYGK